ncbi:MAG: hypothetical protein M0Q38_02630 [Bacteroidales bacterium]|nr:hypothetical protein [Bacteroidales bacterium]
MSKRPLLCYLFQKILINRNQTSNHEFFIQHRKRSDLSSVIRHPPSVIRHPPSVIRHPPSVIRHPPSAVQHKKESLSKHQPGPGQDRIYSSFNLEIMSTTNELTKNYSGIFGNMLLARNRNGKTFMVIPKTKSKKEANENQVNARRKFTLASRYAKTVLQDPDKLVAYTAKSHDGLSPYILALTDYLRPPFVDQIDTSGYHGNPGDKIGVTAIDDFGLTEVTVRIADLSGALIEEGPCAFNLITGNYDFTAAVPVPDTALPRLRN